MGDLRQDVPSTAPLQLPRPAPPGAGPAGTPGGRFPHWLPAAALGVLAAATAGSGLVGLSLPTAAGLVAVLAVLTLSGAGVWRLVVPGSSRAQSVVFGCLLGLALVGAGVALSGWTGWFAVRWLPPLLALAAWLPAVRRLRPPAEAAETAPIGAGLWGAVLATGAMLVSVQRHLATAPVDDAGWRAWYVDLPWHMAFTAEALERSPSVYPWVPDVSLGYTWLFSAALGGWGSPTAVSAADLVTRVAPALLAALLPTAVALLAWVVTRSRTATALAPVVVVLAQAPLFVFRDTMDITPGWLIPNRDYSDLFVVLAVVVVAASSPSRAATPRWQRLAVLGLLVLVSFTAAGSKGSALPALVGGLGVMVLYGLLTRRDRLEHLARLAAVGAGMVLAQYTVTRSLSYLRVDPLTFLGGQEPEGTATVLPLAVTALVLTSLLYVLVTLRQAPALTERTLPLVGVGLAGLAATVLFGHPGLSQLYFLHAAWPLVCTGVAIALAVWVRALGPVVLLGPAVAALGFTLVLAPPADGRIRSWAVGVLVVLTAVLVVVVAPVVLQLRRRPGAVASPVLAVVAAVLSAAFVVQNWGPPEVALPASLASTAADVSAVDGGQREVLAQLHEDSAPEDLVMTNKHCLSGSVPTATCDPRWFAVSAFAERRVLVEGWSYTRLSTGMWWQDVYWDPELLLANDAFIAAPDTAGCARFADAGVRWIYVDKREAWSPQLAEVAELVTETPTAALYRLSADCTG